MFSFTPLTPTHHSACSGDENGAQQSRSRRELDGLCACVFVSSNLAINPPIKARRVPHFAVYLHLFSAFFCQTRTNRGHTGRGKDIGAKIKNKIKNVKTPRANELNPYPRRSRRSGGRGECSTRSRCPSFVRCCSMLVRWFTRTTAKKMTRGKKKKRGVRIEDYFGARGVHAPYACPGSPTPEFEPGISRRYCYSCPCLLPTGSKTCCVCLLPTPL